MSIFSSFSLVSQVAIRKFKQKIIAVKKLQAARLRFEGMQLVLRIFKQENLKNPQLLKTRRVFKLVQLPESQQTLPCP